MAYPNAKEGQGVRARSDLSPNQRSETDTTKPLTNKHLYDAAMHLNGLIAIAENRDRASHILVPVQGAKRLVDALLLAAHPPEGPG